MAAFRIFRNIGIQIAAADLFIIVITGMNKS